MLGRRLARAFVGMHGYPLDSNDSLPDNCAADDLPPLTLLVGQDRTSGERKDLVLGMSTDIISP